MATGPPAASGAEDTGQPLLLPVSEAFLQLGRVGSPLLSAPSPLPPAILPPHVTSSQAACLSQQYEAKAGVVFSCEEGPGAWHSQHPSWPTVQC